MIKAGFGHAVPGDGHSVSARDVQSDLASQSPEYRAYTSEVATTA
jgi:hypothetical protein